MLMQPSLPPAGIAHCAGPRIFSFFFVFFCIAIFLEKICAQKSSKIADPGFLASSLGPKKKIKNDKNSKIGSPGPRFWVIFEPRFANLKTFKFAAMRGVS